MAIGLVDDDEMMGEIEDLDPSIPSVNTDTGDTEGIIIPDNFDPPAVVHERNSGGRNPGDVNVPESVRALIAGEAIENGSQAAIRLAEELGISKQSVAAYKNGATSLSTYNETNQALTKPIRTAKERIAIKARNRLNLALDNITEAKLTHIKATDLAGIAKDMSAIVKNMEENTNPNGPAVQFHLYAPPLRREDSFEVIDAQES